MKRKLVDNESEGGILLIEEGGGGGGLIGGLYSCAFKQIL